MSIQLAQGKHALVALAKHMLNVEIGARVYDPDDRRPPGPPGAASPGVEAPRPTAGAPPWPVITDSADPTATQYRIYAAQGIVYRMKAPTPTEYARLAAILDAAGSDHLRGPRATLVTPQTIVVTPPANAPANAPVAQTVISRDAPKPEMTEYPRRHVEYKHLTVNRPHPEFAPHGEGRTIQVWPKKDRPLRSVAEFAASRAFTWHFVALRLDSSKRPAINSAMAAVAPAVSVVYDPESIFRSPAIPWVLQPADLADTPPGSSFTMVRTLVVYPAAAPGELKIFASRQYSHDRIDRISVPVDSPPPELSTESIPCITCYCSADHGYTLTPKRSPPSHTIAVHLCFCCYHSRLATTASPALEALLAAHVDVREIHRPPDPAIPCAMTARQLAPGTYYDPGVALYIQENVLRDARALQQRLQQIPPDAGPVAIVGYNSANVYTEEA